MSTPQHSDAGRVLTVSQSLRAMLGLCFVIMMVAIDQTVVGTALPTVVADLNGFKYYAWVATAYLLTSVITVPIFGRLGDLYGRKPFVVASVVVFLSASIFCGLSDSMIQLVIARALQGVGGGMLVGTAFASVPDLFPDTQVRLRWQMLLSSAFGVANGVGPTLGGILTEQLGWRAVFFMNVPLGLIALFFLLRYMPHIRQIRGAQVRMDWLGAVLVALGLASLQAFVQLVSSQGASPLIFALVAAIVLAFGLLYYRERHCAHPLLPPEMFRNKSLAALFGLSLFLGFIMFALLFYIPLLLQGGFGMSPQEVGLLITPMVVCITLGSIVNSRIVLRLSRPNNMLYAGFGLMLAASVGIVFMDRETPKALVLAYMMMAGLGLGFVLPNLTVFAQETAGRSLLGISTAMLQSVRMIGGMIGTAVVGTLVGHYYVAGVRAAVPEGQGWGAMLEDPQVLVNHAVQSDFVAQLQRMGLYGEAYIEQARTALVAAVHLGLVAVLLTAFIGLMWVYRLPLVRLSRGGREQKDAQS